MSRPASICSLLSRCTTSRRLDSINSSGPSPSSCLRRRRPSSMALSRRQGREIGSLVSLTQRACLLAPLRCLYRYVVQDGLEITGLLATLPKITFALRVIGRSPPL